MRREHLILLRDLLLVYDNHAVSLESVEDNSEYDLWKETEKELSDLVAEMFADATSEFNSRETALTVRPCYWTQEDFLHQLIKDI